MEEKKDRLDRQFAFIREIDREKLIGRQTWLADGSRKENDAEHAWHLAMMTILLSEYAKDEIDVLRTVTMVLLHDIVEIDAGDTYAYDEKAKESQHDREQAAADRIFGLLPEDQGTSLRTLFEEFEEGNTAEARFAHAMDNLQPMMLNDAAGGKGWIEHGVHLSWLLKRNECTPEGSPVLWDWAKEKIIGPNVEKGNLLDDVTK